MCNLISISHLAIFECLDTETSKTVREIEAELLKKEDFVLVLDGSVKETLINFLEFGYVATKGKGVIISDKGLIALQELQELCSEALSQTAVA